MAINITTAYAGEVLDRLLVRATTGNQLVEKGLMHLEPNVNDKFYIPRLRATNMLRKRIEQPTDDDSKGNFNVDERVVIPVEFMAFTTFNPRSFEKIWRQWQPKGDLVFRELPTSVQNAMLDEMSKVVNFELGLHFVKGVYGNDDAHLFNGITTRILADKDVVAVPVPAQNTMIARLKGLVKAIPETLRENPKLKILMSVTDADMYDDELTAQASKGANYTDMNAKRFKGITIETVSGWPTGLLVATICGMDYDTNLWAGVSAINDFDAIKIDRLTNAGEKYFFKMLMKADTQIAFGEDVVLMDARSAATATLNGTTITMPKPNCRIESTPTADASWNISGDGVELGARLVIVNKSADKTLTIGEVKIEGGKTVTLGYDGTKWFKSVNWEAEA